MATPGSSGFGSGLLLTPAEVAATSQTAPPRQNRAVARPQTRGWVFPARWLEVAAVLLLLAVALTLRTYRLTTLPFGLHGDEATIGLEARRILNEGQIGPYSPEAMGQPAGPIYLTALALKLLGDTILAVRLVPALAGTLTVVALYFVARRSFGVPAALIAATLLATLGWHVHFARIGFPLATWPLCVVLTAGAVVEALRRQDWRWWAASGALAGLGLYTYNAHPAFLGILALFVGLATVQAVARDGRGSARHILGPPLMAATLLLVALPLIDFVLTDPHHYLSHSRAVSIFQRPEWLAQETPSGQARFLGERYSAFWRTACCQPTVDGVDGSGASPLIPAALILLACVGGGMGLLRRQPLVVLAALVVLPIPWVAALTFEGLARRTFVAAPFLVLLAALPLGWLTEQGVAWWRRARGADRLLSGTLIAIPLLAVAMLGPYTLAKDYRAFAAAKEREWVFAADLVDAIGYMNTLPDDSYIYFLAGRWPFDYETRRYLAPHLAGEDRSTEFGARTDLATDRTAGTVVFVLFGRYTEAVEELRARYPQGTTVAGSRGEHAPFIAYRVELRPPGDRGP